MAPSRAIHKLTEVHHAASDIASHQVRVHALQVGRRKNPPRQNASAEARSKTLNLILQFLQHVNFGSVGHVTISPSRVFPGWSP